MTPTYFLDTNVLLYAFSQASDHIGDKQDIARQWIRRDDFGISTQVLMEFYRNARQLRHGLPSDAPLEIVADLVRLFPVQPMDADLVLESLRLSERYGISPWDGAIVCAARKLGSKYLITEDLNHGQDYDGISVINPFRSCP